MDMEPVNIKRVVHLTELIIAEEEARILHRYPKLFLIECAVAIIIVLLEQLLEEMLFTRRFRIPPQLFRCHTHNYACLVYTPCAWENAAAGAGLPPHAQGQSKHTDFPTNYSCAHVAKITCMYI